MERERLIKLSLQGTCFNVPEDHLLRIKDSYFYHMLSSGHWTPNTDTGAFEIDRNPLHFERILEYLGSGELSLEWLDEEEIDILFENLDYFQIPLIDENGVNLRSHATSVD